MRTVTESLSSELTVREALEQIRSSPLRTWLVFDRQRLLGVVSLSALTGELAKGSDKGTLREFVNQLNFPHVHPDHGLDVALERMGANELEIIPVVSRAEVPKVEGLVTLGDVLDSYGVSRT